MAFSKYAKAAVVKPGIAAKEWGGIRKAAMGSATKIAAEMRAAKVTLDKVDPGRFLLSHCTIIASVDTDVVPGVTLGKQIVDGFQIDRKYPDYYIKPNTSQFVNNNFDAWERKLLLACYKTFIGGENYVEHIQIPEMSKGKILDAAARNIGDSVYVDILVATDRKHKPLISAITSGQLGTLSMGCSVQFTQCSKCGNVAEDEPQLCSHIRYFKGSSFIDGMGQTRKIAELCFPAGTRVTGGSGLPIAIDDLQVGDQVLTHQGRRRQVNRVFERQYEGDLVELKVEGLPHTQLSSTPQHPYYVWEGGGFKFKDACDLTPGDRLALPALTGTIEPDDVNEDRAELLGWFLAEGNYLKRDGKRSGVQFTLNDADEREVAERLALLLGRQFAPEPFHAGPIADSWKRTRKGYEPALNHSDRILEYLMLGPSLVSDIHAATGICLGTIQGVLARYVGDGVVASRPLALGEMVDKVSGRSRCRTRVWSLVDPTSRPMSRRHQTVRDTKHQRKPSYSTAQVLIQPKVYSYPRTEGGRKLVVCYFNDQAAEWFYQHAGEYSGSKLLSEDAVFWPVELQSSLLKAYVKGDGQSDKLGRHCVSSVSDDLITQIQLISARCGLWTRRQIIFEGKTTTVQAVANGGVALVGSDGCRPRYELSFQPSDTSTEFFGFSRQYLRKINPQERQQGPYFLYTLRKTSRRFYSGPVFNISVEDDESYLVDNLAVHNCGHIDAEPGSCGFIEGSWVANPAFKGAVIRNILSPAESAALSGNPGLVSALVSAPRVAPPNNMQRAARMLYGQQDPFDFGDQGQEQAPEDQGQEQAPADQGQDGSLDSLVTQLTDNVKDKVKNKVREEINEGEADEVRQVLDENSSNESLIKSALKHDEWQRVARYVKARVGTKGAGKVLLGLIFHKKGAWKAVAASKQFTGFDILAVSRVLDMMTKRSSIAGEARVYRTVVAVGGTAPYEDVETYLTACRQVLGRRPTGSEAGALLEKGRLFALGL